VAQPKNDNLWAMEDFGGFSISTYPTTNGIFNTSGTYNIGGYTDPKADQLIAASTASSNPAAVKAEANYLTLQQPSLFQHRSTTSSCGRRPSPVLPPTLSR